MPKTGKKKNTKEKPTRVRYQVVGLVCKPVEKYPEVVSSTVVHGVVLAKTRLTTEKAANGDVMRDLLAGPDLVTFPGIGIKVTGVVPEALESDPSYHDIIRDAVLSSFCYSFGYHL